MRKAILSTALFFISFLTFSQVKVTDEKGETIGRFRELGTTWEQIDKTDSTCYFIYKDVNYTKIEEYKSFTFGTGDLDVIFSLFINAGNYPDGTVKVVELEDGGKLRFQYKKMMGKVSPVVSHTNSVGTTGDMRWMTQNQVKKLFGKE